MSSRAPIVAIVGRPNVGKSTLFNRLVGERRAIVENEPGVTRDRNYGRAFWLGHDLTFVDTGGFDPGSADPMLALMRQQAQLAMEEADAIVFLSDSREGASSTDLEIARVLRRSAQPVFYAANKIDSDRQEVEAAAFYVYGVETVYAISAEHGRGVLDLMESVVDALEKRGSFDIDEPLPVRTASPSEAQDAQEAEDAGGGGLEPGALGYYFDDADLDPAEEDDGDDSTPVAMPRGGRVANIRVTIVGRPNVGKSTLVNRLIGSERMLVSDVAGTTRDAIDSPFRYNDRDWTLIDTAGLRRKARVSASVERYSVMRAIGAVERSHVVVLALDATQGLADQDAKIAQLAHDRGRALVIVVNKWDLVEKDSKTAEAYTRDLREQLAFVAYAPVVFLSALTGKRVDRVMQLVERAFDAFDRRIGTGPLNRLLEEALRMLPPPVHKGRAVKVYYASQTSFRPPTLVGHVNAPEGISEAWERWFIARLRERFELQGTPVRIRWSKRSARRAGRGSSSRDGGQG